MCYMTLIATEGDTQNKVLLKNFLEFYNEHNLNKIVAIIKGEHHISLRIIDWFITNYSKFYYTVYPVTMSNGETIRFKVHDQYKNKLKSFNKKRFDIFCRHQRISILYDKENSLYLETTIAQLNCFKWAIDNHVIDYIDEHYDDILTDMKNRNSPIQSKKWPREDNVERDNKTRKRRHELSISAVKTLKKEHVNIVVKFN